MDLVNPPSGKVPTRTNSPGDDSFAAFASADGSLTFTTTVLNPNFTAANSVVNGINPIPGQFTGGEGAVSGQEVEFDVTFTTSFSVGATDHDFFRPEVGVTGGNFLWLSAPKPIVAPGTTFSPDLQSWIRNQNLSADWLRIGTDITGQALSTLPFPCRALSPRNRTAWCCDGCGTVRASPAIGAPPPDPRLRLEFQGIR